MPRALKRWWRSSTAIVTLFRLRWARLECEALAKRYEAARATLDRVPTDRFLATAEWESLSRLRARAISLKLDLEEATARAERLAERLLDRCGGIA